MFVKLALTALSLASSALALATPVARDETAHVRRALSAPSSGRVVIYTDDYLESRKNGLPTAGDLAGYNVLILAFLLVKGPADQTLAWKQLSSGDRTSMMNSYNDAGITVMASSFGSTDTPTSSGVDPVAQANTHAAFIKQYGLQGIDVDYEDMDAMNKQNNGAENWLIKYTNQLRQQLPSGQYLITHAPVAPWFSLTAYKTGAYATVHAKSGDNIDWYNIQFYNQGDTQYTNCNNLITKSGGSFPGTSIKEINSLANVPFNKLVLGKPSAAYQADNGYVDFSTLAECIATAGKLGWDAGTMFWEYETSKMNSISGLTKALAAIIGNGAGIPVGPTTTAPSTATNTASVKGGKTTSTPTATTSAPSSSPTSGGDGSCDCADTWDANTIYDGGVNVDNSNVSYVSYNGKTWENLWWTQGQAPEENNWDNPWQVVDCSDNNDNNNDNEKRGVEAVVPAPLVAREPTTNASASRRGSRHNNKLRKVHARAADLS